MQTAKNTATLVYRGRGRKIAVKKSVDETIIAKYFALTGSMRQAIQCYREFKMRLELGAIGRNWA